MADCPACGETLPDVIDGDPLDPLTINGETFHFDKLTYAERRKITPIRSELVRLDNPQADVDEDWTQDDLRVAFAIVCGRRSNPDYSIEDALKLTPAELEPPPATPPTKAASKPRQRPAGK
jgi:hypothetical protein